MFLLFGLVLSLLKPNWQSKKISMSKRDSSLKTSHRSMAVGPVGRGGAMNEHVRWGSFAVVKVFWDCTVMMIGCAKQSLGCTL